MVRPFERNITDAVDLFPRSQVALGNPRSTRYTSAMSTLTEIEDAADTLSSDDKEALLRFLVMRLRKERALPEPRIYTDDEMAAMLAEDEADGTRLREETPNLPR